MNEEREQTIQLPQSVAMTEDDKMKVVGTLYTNVIQKDKIQDWLVSEVLKLRGTVVELNTKATTFEAENVELVKAKESLQQRVVDLEKQIHEVALERDNLKLDIQAMGNGKKEKK